MAIRKACTGEFLITLIDDSQGYYNNPAGPVMHIDGLNLYGPLLNVWVSTSPWSELNSNLEPVTIVPSPVEQVPLDFQGDRFIADILYRDTHWDQIAAIKVFLGGLAAGLGAGVLILPIGLLQPVGNDQDESKDKGHRPSSKRPKRQRREPA